MFRLAVLVSHPIQYYVPVFKLLANDKNIQLKVFYSLGAENDSKDNGFGKKISWDIPLLVGYEYEFLTNISKNKGSHHFSGIDNPNIIERIVEFNPQAILIYGWAYTSHLKTIRYFSKKTKLWFRGDSTLLNTKFSIKSIVKKIFLTWIYKKVDLAFYVGTNNQQYFLSYGLKKEQLTFAPHAIDNQRFEKIDAVQNEFRKKLGIGNDDILILFAGKLEPVKNPMLLLKSFLELNRANVHLLYVGNGVLEYSLKQESVNSKLKENIHFLDFQNQTKMPEVYQSADLFCLPSFSETWGLAVNEAMASGLAVLTSDMVGCAVDLVENEVNGFIFENNNQNDLVSRLRKMTENKVLLKEMGKSSIEKIKNWSFDEQIKAMKGNISN